MNTHPSLSLPAYAGKYYNETFGNADIILSHDSLLLKYPNNISLYLTHWNYDTFSGKYLYEWYDKSMVQFSLNTEGKVDHFEMDGLLYIKQ